MRRMYPELGMAQPYPEFRSPGWDVTHVGMAMNDSIYVI